MTSRNAARVKRSSRRAPCAVAMDALEVRRLMAIAGSIAQVFGITNGSKVAATPNQPGYNLGFFRKGGSGAPPAVDYYFYDDDENVGTRNVSVTVPAGFKLTQSLTQIQGGQFNDRKITVELDAAQVGSFQGDVDVRALDNNETFRFEIKGAVGAFSFDPADNMGTLDVRYRQGQQAIAKAGFADFRRETDGSATSVLMPGVRLYRFALDARSDFGVDVSLPQGQPLGLDVSVFRDANGDGVLQVGEEQNKVTPMHLDDGTTSADASAELPAGVYFLKCATEVPANPFDIGLKRVNYNFSVSAQPLENPKLVVKAKNYSTAIADGGAAADNTGTTFGSVAVGAAVTREFTVTNTGGASTKLTLSPPSGGGGFSILQGLPQTLAAGASASFVLRFAPSSAGAKSGRVVIGNDDPANPQFIFAVAGTGNGAGATAPADTVKPTAAVSSAPQVTARGASPYQFTIRYNDGGKINSATLDKKDVIVKGPNGFASAVTLIGTSSSKKHKVFNATYAVAAPGGSWDRGDNGGYTITLRSKQVRDMAGNAAAPGVLGQFSVKIPKKAAGGAIAPQAIPVLSIARIEKQADSPVWG